MRDVYLRKLAEFDNFRKRVERERDENRQAGAEDFIAELLPVIDNFDRALQHSGDDSGAFREGVEMISKQLTDLLDRRGVAEINPVLCKGDGLCTAKCPTSAVALKHFTDQALLSQIDAAGTGEEILVELEATVGRT